MSVWNPTIFREYDIRGKAEVDLNAAFAERLGFAYAKYLRNRDLFRTERLQDAEPRLRIAVGRDCRLSSDALADGLIRGLEKSGLDVVRLGVCPTPLTYFSVFQLGLQGGIMVTGSHNSADTNGFKICVGRDTLHGPEIQEIRSLMDEIPSQVHCPGSSTDWDPIPPYIDYIVGNARGLRKKKIVIDAGNGTAATVAPRLFQRLGAEVIPLYCELDGRFPNHHPDPTVAENLEDLIRAVRRENADFGVAFDGDSDRIGLVDESGRILYGDEILILFARDVLASNPGATVIGDVKSTYRLIDDVEKRGGKAILWKSGHSPIKSKMKETGALLAGVMAAHIFFSDRYFGYDDAIYAATRAYEIACASPEPFSSLLSDLEPTVSTPEIRVECEEEKKFSLVEEAKHLLSERGEGTLNDLDGIRIDFRDGWGLIRASNTQAAIVLRFEAKSAMRLAEIRRPMEDALRSAARLLSHPPLELDP